MKGLTTPLADLRRVTGAWVAMYGGNKMSKSFLVHKDVVEHFVKDLVDDGYGTEEWPFRLEWVTVASPTYLAMPDTYVTGGTVDEWSGPVIVYERGSDG